MEDKGSCLWHLVETKKCFDYWSKFLWMTRHHLEANLYVNETNKLIDVRKTPLCLPGLQSVRSEQTERRILEIVRAGLQLSFRMSRQIIPWKKCQKKWQSITTVWKDCIREDFCRQNHIKTLLLEALSFGQKPMYAMRTFFSVGGQIRRLLRWQPNSEDRWLFQLCCCRDAKKNLCLSKTFVYLV